MSEVRGRRLGHPRVHHRSVGSTNELAHLLVQAGTPHGTVVTADEQLSGRGRQGRRWQAPPRTGLLASIVLRDLAERHAILPLTVAVAACEACEAAADVVCRIKWPNDIWIGRRKVAGVLIEGRPQERWAVIGVGINVTTPAHAFPPELQDTATSLVDRAGAGAAADRSSPEDVLEQLLAALERRLTEEPAAVLAAWRERDALLGEQISWSGGEGLAAGIAADGSLLVDTRTGQVSIDAGEVHLGPQATS